MVRRFRMIRVAILLVTASCIIIWMDDILHSIKSTVYGRSYGFKSIENPTARHIIQDDTRKITDSFNLSPESENRSSLLHHANDTNDIVKRDAQNLRPIKLMKIHPTLLPPSPTQDLRKRYKIENASYLVKNVSQFHDHTLVKDGIFFNRSMHGQHPYNYVHKNSNYCIRNNDKNSIFLLIMCLTAPDETSRRATIRRTWANVTDVLGRRVATIFLLANSSEKLNKVIAHESKIFGDICKADFVDSYRNLTLKTLMGFRWVNSFCNHTKFVLKIDSDVVPNLFNLVRHLETRINKTTFEGHLMKGIKPVRDNITWIKKWYLSESVYPHPTYPPYAIGMSYLVSSNLVNLLVSVSEHIPYIHIEDVYVGMLMKTIGVSPTHDKRYTQHRMSLKSENTTFDALCSFSKVFTVTILNPLIQMHQFWALWDAFDSNKCSNFTQNVPYY
ncbi:beta-1,3-galactosyltransferase 1-like [Amphiura filiformis]|uniref:beta-1,3-galactosyltransferase 1-like n=1 Tax=Amphiura filiformis TaxID=82378 RepID=UPI003B224CF6